MKNNKIIIIAFLISILLFGCKQDNKSTEFKKKDKAPDSLANLSKSLDDIFISVGEIEKINLGIPTKAEEEAKKQASDKGGGSDGSGGGGGQDGSGGQGQGQGQNQDQGQSQGGGNQQQKPPSKEDLIKVQWDKIEKTLEQTHTSWNQYEPDGMKKGATKEQGDKFEAALNKFTAGVENKNIVEIYDYGSQSYSNLKPFYDLYTDELGGDLSMLKYAAYQAYIRAIEGDHTKAETVLNEREENVNKIRMKIPKEDEKAKVDKLSLSLTDFKDALKDNSKRLFMIKKDVIIEGINDIKE